MIIKKEMDYPKEISEVLMFVKELIKTVKEKGDYTMLVDDLIKAVEGIDEVGDEVKNYKALSVAVSEFGFDLFEIFAKKDAPSA